MRNSLSVCNYLLAVLIIPLHGFSQATNDTKNLSTLMGAIDKIVEKNTQISGFNEEPSKLTPSAEQAADDIANELEDCQTTKSEEPQLVVVEKDGVTTELKTFDLKISGERCPLEMSMSVISDEQTPEKFVGEFNMSIVFKTEGFIEKYRMRHIKATGVIKAHAEKKGTTVTLPVSVEITSTGDSLDMGLFSQKISIKVSTSVNLANFSFTALTEQNASLKYGQIDQKGIARLKINGFSAPEQSFMIDDKKVSETEFQVFLQSFVVAGLVSEEDPQTPDGRRPTRCKVVAYDKQAISETDLKIALSKPAALPEKGQLAKAESCLKNKDVSFKNGSDNLNGLLDFQTDWISFNVQNTATKKSLGDVFVLYGDNAPQTSITDSMVLGLKCEGVPTCN
ncbi:MAG: hypothetical protein V4654_00455 [Bdellovibrionota bacterium]